MKHLRNKGISISGTNFISQPTINGVNVKGNIDSTYKSVKDQSGIHAGNDGVNITVGNTTTVKGATITSKALSEKNKMSTNSLVMEDLHNEASYKAKKSGVDMNTSGLTAKGVLGEINPLGLSPVVSIPVLDEAQSTTKSAISDTILVEVERKPLTAINRDTEHALNSIKPIFDKADVKERMEYVNAVSDEGSKLIGEIAMKQAQKYEEIAATTTDEALKKRYKKEADKWKDGGIYKVALHGGFGAVVSNMAGGSSLEGFTVSSANEVMVGAIAQELAKHPNSTIDANGKYVDNSDVYKIASAILGNTVSHSSLGAGISLSATQNNYLTHEQNQLRLSQLAAAKTEKEHNEINTYWLAVDRQQEAELINKIKNEYYKKTYDRDNPYLYSLIRKYVRQYKDKVGAVDSTYGFINSNYNSDGGRVYTINIIGKKESFNGLPDGPSMFRFVDIVPPATTNKTTFAWTKDALGKSVAQNVLSEVGNQPWTGYVYYAENASKLTKTVAKSGGPVAIGFLIKDFYTDYQMYSGRELAKAWGANLIPVATGLGGGVLGSGAGPAGAFVIGVTGATFGDRIKDEIKFNLKKDVDK